MEPKLNAGNIETYYNDYSIIKFLKSNLNLLSGNVLDIGCGKMKHKDMILSGTNVKSYTGLDLIEGEFTYSVKADIYWDGKRIPISDNSIDSIILFEVIEHCPDPSITVKESFRILKPGGSILFSTPFIYHLHGSPFDYNRPTPFGLQKLFKDAGFKNISITSGGRLDTSLAQMIAIWISNRKMGKFTRKLLRHAFVPIFKFLMRIDSKYLDLPLKDGTMIPNLLGIAQK